MLMHSYGRLFYWVSLNSLFFALVDNRHSAVQLFACTRPPLPMRMRTEIPCPFHHVDSLAQKTAHIISIDSSSDFWTAIFGETLNIKCIWMFYFGIALWKVVSWDQSNFIPFGSMVTMYTDIYPNWIWKVSSRWYGLSKEYKISGIYPIS